MRLLVITPLYIPWVGGLENFVRQVIVELRTRGHEVAVLTSHESTRYFDDEVDGVAVHRVPAHHVASSRDAGGILHAQVKVARVISEFEPDLVHSHDAGPVLWMYTRAARRHHRPVVVTLHNVMTHHFTGNLSVMAKLLQQADAVTAVSQAVADDTLTFEPSIADRLRVIRNAIAPSSSEATPVPVDPPSLLCVGRLVRQKGFDLAIDAMAMLAPRHPDLRLTIAGAGPERGALVEQAAARGVTDCVTFLGSVPPDEIAAHLARSSLVLMPSRFEGLPLVAIEAAWAGRGIIATRAPGLTEALVDGTTGVVVPPEDPEALAAAIELMVGDPDRLVATGRAAREFAETSYSFPACVDAYEDMYRALTGPRAT